MLENRNHSVKTWHLLQFYDAARYLVSKKGWNELKIVELWKSGAAFFFSGSNEVNAFLIRIASCATVSLPCSVSDLYIKCKSVRLYRWQRLTIMGGSNGQVGKTKISMHVLN